MVAVVATMTTVTIAVLTAAYAGKKITFLVLHSAIHSFL
jgi:hypothetical protein